MLPLEVRCVDSALLRRSARRCSGERSALLSRDWRVGSESGSMIRASAKRTAGKGVVRVSFMASPSRRKLQEHGVLLHEDLQQRNHCRLRVVIDHLSFALLPDDPGQIRQIHLINAVRVFC